MLPHKTRVRHKKQHRSRTFSKTKSASRESRWGPGGPGRGVQERSGGCTASRKTRKIRQTFRSCLSSLLRSCIQDCVQEVPVGQMAQGTPPRRTPRPRQVASSGFINFSIFFYHVSSEVFSKSSSVMSSFLLLLLLLLLVFLL